MNASGSSPCPRCGAPLPGPLPGGSPEQLCPACLLSAATAPTEPLPGARMPDIADPEEMARRLPQFEILELLGRGGMGAVYRARQRQLDRVVALKILPPAEAQSPDFVERFRREAKSLAKLNHPNIVTVHDFGEGGGLSYLVMEYVDGMNLRELIRARRLTPAEALGIVPKICEALQFAHEEGVVHRDIKPENILIDKKGRVKIADFGLAKLLRREATDFTLTMAGMALGTPRYMAPEQLETPETVDHRADIYSLGVVFYEMLTGEVPMGRFDPPSKKVQVDVKLDEIVLHALEREPDRRYQHASEVKSDVETICALSPGASASIARVLGREYRSKATLFGVPLLHVATGFDPRTGRKRIARGIIALGDVAIGVFAAGGVAMGGVTFGGVSLGLVAIGGGAVGLLAAVGGLAIAGLAFGGGALGVVALGGGAVGYYAFGGGAWGAHVMSSSGVDPQARELFQGWAEDWPRWLALIGLATPLAAVLVGFIIWLALRSGAATGGWNARALAPQPEVRPRRWLLPALLTLLFVIAFFFGLSFHTSATAIPEGRSQLITVGALDPLFIYESGLPPGNASHTSFNPFTWSFLAVVIAGMAVSAGWRIDREDRGRVPRDPAWWRHWWTQAAIWGGLLLVACLIRTVMVPHEVLRKGGERTGAPAEDGLSGLSSGDSAPAASAPANAGGAAPPAPEELLRRMEESYRSLSTFRASGKITSEFTPREGVAGKSISLSHAFSIVLARPEFYRITWKQAVGDFYTIEGAVWFSGSEPSLLRPDGKVVTLLNRDLALAAAGGVSGGASLTIPRLFFGDPSPFRALTNVARLPDQSVDGEECIVLAAAGPGGQTTLWIRHEDFILKQIRQVVVPGTPAEDAPASLESMTDESLGKLLKILGHEVSPEAARALREELEKSDGRTARLEAVITERFETISTNELMEKADFEPPAPVASPRE